MQTKINALFFVLFILNLFSAKADMKSSSWLKSNNCTEMTLLKYKSISNDKVLGEVTIRNEEFIKSIIEQLNKIPVMGDEKISWGKTAQRMQLSFRCGKDEYTSIEIINKKFKTPSTGFNSEKNPAEEKLANDLESIVTPELGSKTLKVKDHPIRFKNFSITYVGEKHTPQPPGGPTVGPTSRHFFNVSENDSANLVTLDIFDGHAPPQPQGFIVEKKIYYLLTYAGLKGESLYPNYFVVAEKLPNRR